MADYTTNANIVVSVNGQQAKKMLTDLKKQAEDLKQKIKDASDIGDTKKAQALSRQLKQVNRQIRDIEAATMSVNDVMKQLDKASPNQLNKALAQIRRQLKGMMQDDPRRSELEEQFKKIKAQIDKVNGALKESQTGWERFTSTIKKWQTGFIAGLGSVTGFVMTARKAVDEFAGIEQEMANVRKYTGMTVEEVEELNEAFKKMDTRTSREDLNKLAQEAGRLGKSSVEDVLGFVRASDQINVALEDLGEGATLTLSKLTGIFGDEKRLGTEKALLSVGSVINELAQNCAASAPYLTEFASRLGGVGAQAGLTVQQIMSFAAVLDSNNAAVEKSATALQQLIVKMLQEPEKYAKAAGLEVKSFSELVKTDMNQALITFLDTLNQAGKMDTLAPLFAEMKEKGSGTVATLATLAGHIEEVKNQQLVANQAFDEAISVTNEFNVQNGTVQAGLEKSKKSLSELMAELGKKLLPVVELFNSTSRTSLELLNMLVDFVKEYWKVIVTLTAAIAAYKITIEASNIALKAHYGWLVLTDGLMKTWKATVALCNMTLGLMTGNTVKARNAMMAFNAVCRANPLGLLVSVLTAAAGAVWYFATRTKEAAKKIEEAKKKQEEYKKSLVDFSSTLDSVSKKEISRLEQLYKGAVNQAGATTDRERAARKLISLYPEYFKNMSSEQIMLGNAKIAYDKLKSSILEVAKAKAIEAKIEENMGSVVDLELENKKLQREREMQEARVAGSQMSYNTLQNNFDKKHTNYFSRTFLSSAQDRIEVDNARMDYEKNQKLLSEIEEKMEENNQKLKDIKEANNELHSMNKGMELPEEENNDGNSFSGSGGTDKEAEKLSKAAAKKAREEFRKGLQDIKAEELKAFTEAETEYSSGQSNYLQYIEAKRAAEEKYFDDSIKFYEENLKSIKGYNVEEDKDYQNLLLKKQEAMQKYENKRISYSADTIRRMSEYEQQALKEEYQWKENKTIVDETALQEELLATKVKYLRQEQDLYAAGTQEWESLQLQIEDTVEKARMEKEKQFQNAVAQMRKQFGEKTVEQQFKIQRQVLEFLKEQGKITVEEFEKMLEQLDKAEKKAREKEKESLPGSDYSRSSGEKRAKNQADLDLKNKELKAALEQGKISLEEYEIMIKKVQQDSMDAWLEPLKNCGDEWVNLLTNMGESWYNFFDSLGEGDWTESLSAAMTATVAVMSAAMQQLTTFIEAEVKIQTAAVEKKYDKEIERAEGNNYKVKKLEKQKEQELARIKNEANKKMFAMQVIQAVAQTATNALNAYGSAAAIPVVGHILAPIAAATAVAAGMVQVAAIKKEQQAAESQGYAEGGFTPSGPKYREVGVVHAGEWVASQKLVNNPRTRQIIEALDYAQRTNTVGSISAFDVSRSITAPMVRAAEVNVPVSAGSDPYYVQTQDSERLNESLDKLNKRLDEPFVTVNTVAGDYGIQKAQNDYNKLMKNKSPKSKK